MKRILIFFCLVILLILFTVPVLGIDCKIVITRDHAYLDKWNKTTGHDTSVITATPFVLKKEDFAILLFLSNYKASKNNTADVTYDIRIIGPDEKTYLERKNLKAVGADLINPGPVFLSKENLELCFSPDDKIGDYLVEVNLKDNIVAESKSFKSQVKLIDYIYRTQFADIQTLSAWMNSYYKNPAPEKAVDAFYYYAQIMLNERRSAFLPTLVFFLEIFDNNTYLFPSLINFYGSQNYATKIFALYLLRYSGYDISDFVEKLSQGEKDAYRNLLDKDLPDPYGKITEPSQVDMLWGIFLGSGNYKPVKKLIDTLELSEYKGCQTKYTTSEKTEADRQKAVYDALYQIVKTSLKNNSAQYPLVKEYCTYAYENEPISDRVKAELKEILGK